MRAAVLNLENLVTNSLDLGMEKKNLVVVKYSRTRKLDRIADGSLGWELS